MSAPRCLTCGNAIRKWTEHHETGWSFHGAKGPLALQFPRNKADCQRLANGAVVHIDYRESDAGGRRVYAFTTWDGETYEDKDFCKNVCAETFGREIAEAMRMRGPISIDDPRKHKE